MKKYLTVLAVASVLISCGGNETADSSSKTVEVVPAPSANSARFNDGFQKLLTSYYQVKDGLTQWDTAAANNAAIELAVLADSLDVKGFPNDSSGAVSSTADSYAGTITGSAKALAGEKDITAKRREFQMISDAVYDMARAVKYDGAMLYHIKCPMAFNDSEEAYWVSDVSDVRNPYLGVKHPTYKDKMLHCGEVTDSIGIAR